jgi:hypothetical protein
VGVLGKVIIVDGRKVHCCPGDGCQATTAAIRNLLLCNDCKSKENIKVENGIRLFRDRENGGRWAPLKGKLPTEYSIPNAYLDDPIYMEAAMNQLAYARYHRNKHNQKKKEEYHTASVQEKKKIRAHKNKIYHQSHHHDRQAKDLELNDKEIGKQYTTKFGHEISWLNTDEDSQRCHNEAVDLAKPLPTSSIAYAFDCTVRWDGVIGYDEQYASLIQGNRSCAFCKINANGELGRFAKADLGAPGSNCLVEVSIHLLEYYDNSTQSIKSERCLIRALQSVLPYPRCYNCGLYGNDNDPLGDNLHASAVLAVKNMCDLMVAGKAAMCVTHSEKSLMPEVARDTFSSSSAPTLKYGNQMSLTEEDIVFADYSGNSKSKRANGKKRRDLRNQKAVKEALYEMSTEH